jgi:hypothetical protein
LTTPSVCAAPANPTTKEAEAPDSDGAAGGDDDSRIELRWSRLSRRRSGQCGSRSRHMKSTNLRMLRLGREKARSWRSTVKVHLPPAKAMEAGGCGCRCTRRQDDGAADVSGAVVAEDTEGVIEGQSDGDTEPVDRDRNDQNGPALLACLRGDWQRPHQIPHCRKRRRYSQPRWRW